jgi:hypothetical protein
MKEDSEDNEWMMAATGTPSQMYRIVRERQKKKSKLYWLAQLMRWRVCKNLPKATSIT